MYISWKITISPQVPPPHYSSTPEWVFPLHWSTSQCWQTQNWLLELWSSCPSCWAPPPWSTPSICCWPARCWLLERATGMKYFKTLIWITWDAVSVGDDHNSDWGSRGVEEEGEKEIINLLLKIDMLFVPWASVSLWKLIGLFAWRYGSTWNMSAILLTLLMFRRVSPRVISESLATTSLGSLKSALCSPTTPTLGWCTSSLAPGSGCWWWCWCTSSTPRTGCSCHHKVVSKKVKIISPSQSLVLTDIQSIKHFEVTYIEAHFCTLCNTVNCQV